VSLQNEQANRGNCPNSHRAVGTGTERNQAISVLSVNKSLFFLTGKDKNEATIQHTALRIGAL